MNRAALSILLLLLLGCGREAASRMDAVLHRLEAPIELSPEDEARVADGWLPVLILQDGAPCPSARYLVRPSEAFVTGVFSDVSVHGTREWVLDTAEPGVSVADDRGLAWFRPEPSGWIWRFVASSGNRTCSEILSRRSVQEGQAAARMGFVRWHVDLLPVQEWSVRLEGVTVAQVSDVPLFLSLPNAGVWCRLSWTGEGTVSGLDPDIWSAEYLDDKPVLAWTGFDRRQAKVVGKKRDSASLDFDLSRCGSLEVRLLDLDGRPLTAQRAVFFSEADSAGESDWGSAAWTCADLPSAIARDGSVLIRGVPVGRKWRVGAALLDGGWVVSTVCQGPGAAGERALAILSAAAESTVVRGRIREEDGSPAAGAAGGLRMNAASSPFVTDEAGGFEARIPTWFQEERPQLRLESLPDECGVRRSVSIGLAELLAGGGTKDWTWREGPEPIVATGRILDEAGVGVADADVFGVMSLADGKSNPQGYFAVYGASEHEQESRLQASAPWHLCPEVEILPGQRDVSMRAQLGARLGGRLEGDARRVLRSFRAIRGDGTMIEDDYLTFSWLWGNGMFEIGPIPPDATEVLLDCDTAGTAVLKDLRLEAGKVYRLPEPVALAR